jgi:MerR family transcriptional regulator, thiopeptide resistance regulator
MRTVGEVADLTGVTVRTLHHYDQIGLVRASGRTDAGYRLYDTADLERLQAVLVYRALGFALTDIRAVMDDDTYDRGQALHDQRDLLAGEIDRMQRILAAVDDAIAAHEAGTTMSDETMFEVFGAEQRARQAEAEQRWGDTDAYGTSRRRTADYTKGDWEDLKVESEAIMDRIAGVYRSGARADSEPAMRAVEAHRRQISERFYDCSHQMQVHLGEMYVTDPRFTATYEAIEEGLAVWVRDAIRANAARAGVT